MVELGSAVFIYGPVTSLNAVIQDKVGRDVIVPMVVVNILQLFMISPLSCYRAVNQTYKFSSASLNPGVCGSEYPFTQ